jgi:hypothetical protein
MHKNELDFETWFSNVAEMVADQSDARFSDKDAVRKDYENGRNCADVAKEIADEYSDWGPLP